MTENKLKLEFGEYVGHEYNGRNQGRDWALLSLSSGDSGIFDIFYPEGNDAHVEHYRDGRHTGGWSDVGTYEGFGIWLSQILEIKDGESISYQTFNAPEEPILIYTPIDNEKGKFVVAYEDESDPWAEGVKPIDIEITKEELVKTFYIALIKRIIDCYKGTEWYSGDLNECESLFGFFSRSIDIYLKEHGVEDIDELVKKARDIIKGDIQEVYEMYDNWYFNGSPKSEMEYIADEFAKVNPGLFDNED